METCVLIPPALSLVLCVHPPPRRFLEMSATVWANSTLLPGTVFRPDDGEIRLDTLEIYSLIDRKDVRLKFGCFDEIEEVEEQEVRHCNWVRFLRASSDVDAVNLVATRVDGSAIFQVVKTIPPNGELLVYFDSVTDDVTSPRREVSECDAKPERTSSEFDDGQTVHSDVTDTASAPDDESSSAVSDLSPDRRTPEQTISPQSLCSSTGQHGRSLTSLSPPVPFRLPSGLPLDLSSQAPRYPQTLISGYELPMRRKEKTWLPCEVCGKKFDRPSLLKRHMRTHTGEKPHACDVCGKAFSTSSSLNTHRRIHSGEKPHQCQICGKRFTASSNLYYHRMTHKKEKPHKCSLCSKSFPTPGDLKSHMYVHSGSWPFKCDTCNRGFSKQTNLRNHMLLHSGDKPHLCSLCGKKFALQCNLKTHLKTHEEDTQEECRSCGRASLASRMFNRRCVDCSSDKTTTTTTTTTTERTGPSAAFSIESLVSPGHPDRRPVGVGRSPPLDVRRYPSYYANAVMSAGILPMRHGGQMMNYHLGGWPKPVSPQYGM